MEQGPTLVGSYLISVHMVDYEILIECLENWVGLRDNVLKWVKSYRTLPFRPNQVSKHLIKISWSTIWKAALRSSKINMTFSPLSTDRKMSLTA